MYRPPSPVFDVPELPTLRRVKPLPKRRRTSGSAPHDHLDTTSGAGSGAVPNSTAQTTASGQHLQGPDGSTTQTQEGDDRAAAAPASDTLTAQMALQAYYMPVLGGVRDLFKASPPDSRASTPLDLSSALAGLGTGFFGSYGSSADGTGFVDGRDTGADEDESGEGDYVDHLQQPGNTKKRKVPANMSGSAHGHDAGSTGSGAEDESGDRSIPTGRGRDGDAVSVGIGGVGGGGTGGGGGSGSGAGLGLGPGTQGLPGRGGRRGRLTRATLAGLQHKEVLRSRKRQLAAVLGALAHGDTLALDQALSASYPFVQTGVDYQSGAPVRVRLSRRREARLARAYKAYKESLVAHSVDSAEALESQAQADGDETKAPAPPPPAKPPQTETQLEVPSTEFTFVFHSATSDRLVATREEVAVLHSRFEEELARQAVKAAEAAKQAAAAFNGPVAKRADRTKQGSRSTASGKEAAGDQKNSAASGALDSTLLGGSGAKSSKGGKKKKRSALANASNPHHLRNYVPSRLPHTGPPSAQQAAQNAQNLLSPLPLRFLSAEIPPRRLKKPAEAGGAGARGAAAVASVAPAAVLANPAEEWICPFCEYQLFYGDEQSFHRAVRNRKKILRRRRRARERAAAAASGVAPAAAGAAAATAEKAEFEDGHAAVDAPAAVSREPATSPGKAAKWKEGDRGGRGVAAHA
ncbi:hypothetical protein BD414DRAFT_507998 [Trametes punicea]|nr:hypothetical protein BD414DRAFT_507998 [Trametes punicea]